MLLIKRLYPESPLITAKDKRDRGRLVASLAVELCADSKLKKLSVTAWSDPTHQFHERSCPEPRHGSRPTACPGRTPPIEPARVDWS
jgi:hypothetical protein